MKRHSPTLLFAGWALVACPSPPPVETTADRFSQRDCLGEAAPPPELQAELSRISPDVDSCERHRLADEPALLFVRTMNTVAHDDEGNRLPACTWEVFRTSGGVRHLGTLSACELRLEGPCVYSLDENPPRRVACLVHGRLVGDAVGSPL